VTTRLIVATTVSSPHAVRKGHIHMEQLPRELREQIPKLYQTRREADPIVWVKFISPILNWRWLIVEYEEVDGTATFYGWMHHVREPFGRFIRSNLESMRAHFGLIIERDTGFAPCRLSEALNMDSGVQKFPLGQIVATPGALAVLEAAGRTPMEFLMRHARGDWGELDEHDRLANEQALDHGGRLLSSYYIVGERRLWILTEGDRSATTLLLPSEY
jgi:hypothetical protein